MEQGSPKLASRCTKGIFAAYDRNSPAYFVLDLTDGKVKKYRCVKFLKDGDSLIGKRLQEELFWALRMRRKSRME